MVRLIERRCLFIDWIKVGNIISGNNPKILEAISFTNNKVEKDAESLVPHMIWLYKHNIGVGRTEFTLEELDNAIRDAIAKLIQEAAEFSVQR